MSRQPTPADDARWNSHTGSGDEPPLGERITITCGRADRHGKCRVTASLDGAAIHYDTFEPYSAYQRGLFAQAVHEKATGNAPDESTNLRWIGDKVTAAAEVQEDQRELLTPKLSRLADVVPEQVPWLWPPRIALGKLTLLAGDPGLGKSFLTLDLAARISVGAPWPDDPHEDAHAGRSGNSERRRWIRRYDPPPT